MQSCSLLPHIHLLAPRAHLSFRKEIHQTPPVSLAQIADNSSKRFFKSHKW